MKTAHKALSAGKAAGAGRTAAQRTRYSQNLIRGIWRENPVFRQLLGLCPALAVSNTVSNSLAMGLATTVVLVGSSTLVSLLKNVIPQPVRLSTYILITATWVTAADMVMEALVPEVQKALGAFVYLIVVNCMILSRQEAFASRFSVTRSVLDSLGTGIGFTIAMLLMGSIREVIGYGSFLGVSLFGPSYEPWTIMILPPGGFIVIGVILLIYGAVSSRAVSAEMHAHAHMSVPEGA